MLFVLFQLGKNRYALEASRVVEVVPLLALKPFPQAPRGVAGIFVYRGQPVPALDLCELTLGRPALEHLSTRILIVQHSKTAGEKEFVDAGVKLASAPFLGPVLMDEQGIIQLLDAQKLLDASGPQLRLTHSVEANDAPH